MMNISDNTLQINAWIGLCHRDSKFPNPLRNLKYSTDNIEPSFYANGKKINPDIILTSKKFNHSIIIDAKSKTLKEDQLEKYRTLKDSPQPLHQRGKVEIINPNHFSVDVGLSSCKQDLINKPQIKDSLTIVRFEEEKGKISKIKTFEGNNFEDEKLKKVFPIDLDEDRKVPTEYYPFGSQPEDEKQLIISVLTSILSITMEKGKDKVEVDTILEDCHPFWERVDESMKKELRSKVSKILNKLSKEKLDETLEKVSGTTKTEWKVVARSLQSFQNKCQHLIDEIKDEIKQTTMEEFEDPNT
ncbi:PD-(DE)xK superfamily endonuclease [Methanonatronarchaeum thermophilum]|uniref:PD-(DE)xK superfamily endonuclease n=1 Tax=Methanonatronarchaeum thermophilum TaxID=1927129 RepID=A0A1Y3GFD1_9EURY|nr:hypothetical protein [Methanonatronarchaeum thermophilum]OUJ18904.1 PD-(DE)xK superfamily endonuclease [Methanonatronarchaeum thermophilum]